MPELSKMVGETIVAIVPMISKTKLQRIKLLGVENGGLWIESQSVTEMALGISNAQAAPKTLVLFLPWHQITVILSSADYPSLSEIELGV